MFRLGKPDDSNPRGYAGAYRCCAIFALLLPVCCILLIAWRLQILLGQKSLNETRTDKDRAFVYYDPSLIPFLIIGLALQVVGMGCLLFDIRFFHNLRKRSAEDLILHPDGVATVDDNDNVSFLTRVVRSFILLSPILFLTFSLVVMFFGFVTTGYNDNPVTVVVLVYAAASVLATASVVPWRRGWTSCLSKQETADFYRELNMHHELPSTSAY